MRNTNVPEHAVDRIVDAGIVASGTLVLANIESAMLIFSLCLGGVYYGMRAYVTWKHRNDPPKNDD